MESSVSEHMKGWNERYLFWQSTTCEVWEAQTGMCQWFTLQPPSKTPAGVLPWTCRSERKRPSRQTGGQSNPHEWLASRKMRSVEELEKLPAVTKPRTSHHRSPGGERRGKRKRALDDLPLKGRETAIVKQTNIGTVSKAKQGKLLRERGGAHKL